MTSWEWWNPLTWGEAFVEISGKTLKTLGEVVDPFREGTLLGYEGPFWKAGEAITYPFRALGIVPAPAGEPEVGIPAAIEKVEETVDWGKKQFEDITGKVAETFGWGKEQYEAMTGKIGETVDWGKEQIGGTKEFIEEQFEETKEFIEGAWGSVKTGMEQIIIPFSELGRTFVELTKTITEKIKTFEIPELAPKLDITLPKITMPQIVMPSLEIPSTLPLALGGIAIAALLIMG